MTAQETTKILQEWLDTGAINLFGLPFAGKDTQGARLSKLFNAPMIGGGEILRSSTIPPHVQTIMKNGELVPTEDYLQIVLPFLSQEQYQHHPLILSSVGRWHGEEPSVIEALKQSNHALKAVVFLDLDERTIWQRWEISQGHDLRGSRHDDAADALEVRLEEFRIKTQPVLDFYRSIDLLIEINGHQSKYEVEKAITAGLLAKAQA